LYKTAADAGHAGAQSELGEAYENGMFGLEIDQKAAESGEHLAQRVLGFAYENRKFYEKFGQLTDEDEALKWSKKAAAGGWL
jgi:TPR repeat protein